MRRGAAMAVLVLLAAACGDSVSPTLAPPPPDIVTLPPATRPPVTPATVLPTVAPTTAPPTTTTVPPPRTTAANGPVTPDDVEVALALVTTTQQPVFVTAPVGDDRLFVVDQPGRIWVVDDGVRLSPPFLDIRNLVTFRGEQGLLGMAFHPEYEDNGLFYVHYTDRRGDTRLVEYEVSRNANRADTDSDRLLLTVDQPAANHNGGMITFGPDGHLYVGLGDGGGANDQFEHGQDPSTLLGTILRLDVDERDPGEPYGIPPDNPFAASTRGSAEVWQFGLRNPWRFSFDVTAGRLWIGDVGQNQWEEIDLVPAGTGGVNFGWSVMEGSHCFSPPTGCGTDNLIFPVHEYSHREGCSVTGGYAYRGQALPELTGLYFFGDFCGGWIRSLEVVGTSTVLQDWTPQLGEVPGLSSFGIDAEGELYVMSVNGQVYKVIPG